MKETLTSRLVDRPIRPLFPEWFHDEVQVQCFVVASDRQNDADVLAMNGASVCLGLSPLPFQGPVAAVRLGRIDGQWVPFPTQDDLEASDLDLVVSGSKEAVCMIEGFAREMPEAEMLDAINECTGSSSRFASCRKSCSAKSTLPRSNTRFPPPTASTSACKGPTTRLQGRQADRRQARPGRRRRGLKNASWPS